MNDSPIIFIDPDEDDQSMFRNAIRDLNVSHPFLVFSEGQAALDYLEANEQAPFLILSEIIMPGMDGLELRQQIESKPELRKKSIPFIFVTYPVHEHVVERAYELTIQGLFEKPIVFQEWRTQLEEIIRYWTSCYHPKRFAKKD